ncbi:sigma 54-interacting transcriptional regulator [Geosporobacter ferrireducens]|uniref:RNA polymerase subunit sigma-54 n=1 Tax=Geosporobacter ferrireducens TaxID=1424294 RepID=A0A1D8GNW5_9FIRM|nr:sigma 54-interacting transcriptional regulator [Geosporobacter ferrireducens]AOT72631.1 RNA polymerase subunit sigma-54 [Geosporobacter ferrireducens]MTI55033.1 PRD domain-containing protein [Geosporobacter ferrireducens]
MKRLLDLIQTEDKKNPLTDEEIAKALGINRSDVVNLRHTLNIGDSRERRKELLEEEIRKILESAPDISERGLTEELNTIGFKLSRNVVSKFLKLSKRKEQDCNNKELVFQKQSRGAFDKIIGADGSLKPQIELAKAAVLYPVDGLHTLIYGGTGVGKSELAESMYKFAIEANVKPQDAPFIVFNCADYAENPQLLLAQLFGYAKGAYTGAETNKEGLVEKANNGILFLDEVHRLPPEGQEILFFLIDKGKFRRLGETNIIREVKLMIIAATTEDFESSLLATFRRRIPMMIEIPSLSQRPLEEKFEIVRNFFRQEATRMNVSININYDVIIALLLYETNGNIGQLRSDIQVVCARGFLNYMVKKQNNINIEITDLPSPVVKGLLKINTNRKTIEKIINSNLEIYPEDESILQKSALEAAKESGYIFPKEIYKEIEDKYQKMEFQGVDAAIINRILADELEMKIRQLIKQFQYNKHNLIKKDLEKIVGEKIILAVEEMMKKAIKNIPDTDESLFYCLATHLSAAYERILQNKFTGNPQLSRICMEYPAEYKIAEEMSKIASYYLEIDLPEDEIAFIAMYLKTYSTRNILNENHVAVLVLSHGHVAEGMVYVANRLLGVEHARAIEMSLDESPSIVLEKAIESVTMMDQGKGVLILVDMGSLSGFGNIITERTGIRTRTITRVDTTMVIEAVRKALTAECELNDIADFLENERFLPKNQTPLKSVKKIVNVILSVCLTGKGAAEMLGKVIKEKNRIKEKVEIITLGALTDGNLDESIQSISSKKNILSIVGTIDPKVPGIPYISAKEILKGDGINRLHNLIDIFDNPPDRLKKGIQELSFQHLFNPELMYINVSARNKNEVLNRMANRMVEYGHVTERYVLSIHEREIMMPTVFKNMVALPHGSPEEIIQPAISIMTLAAPIIWDGEHAVDCVFMLGLNQYYKKEFRKLYTIFNNERVLSKIKKCKTADMLMEVLLTNG